MRSSMRVVGVAAVLGLLAVACGDDSGGGEAGGTTTTSTADTADTAPPIGPEVAGIDFGVLDLPPGDPYEDYVMVQDDTGVIEVQLPEDWSFLNTKPPTPVSTWGSATFQVDDLWASQVVATVDPRLFEDSLGVNDESGASVRVGDASYASSEERALDRLTLDSQGLQWGEDPENPCEQAGSFDYDDGTYTGQAELWTDCASTYEAELLIGLTVDAAADAEDSETDLTDYASIHVRLLTDADIDAATRLIESLNFTPTTP